MDRPAGAYVIDEKTGELKPDLNDEAMKKRLMVEEGKEIGQEKQNKQKKIKEVDNNA